MRVKLVAIALLTGALMMSATVPAHAFGSGRQKTPEEEAAEQLKKATKKYNQGLDKMEKAKMHLAKGDTTKARKDFERAAKKYKEAIDLHPEYPEALNNLAYSMRLTGYYDIALEYYDRAIELRPDFVQAHEYRARAYLALDRVDDAVAEYEYLLEQGEDELATELKETIDAWVLAKVEGRKVSAERSGW
jgi:tetratricopeptide (TPR) repeat protein